MVPVFLYRFSVPVSGACVIGISLVENPHNWPTGHCFSLDVLRWNMETAGFAIRKVMSRLWDGLHELVENLVKTQVFDWTE